MSINPTDYEELDAVVIAGFESARMGYPLRRDEVSDHKKGWKAYHKQREAECKRLNIPYRPPTLL